jgi:DNA (cytosine-5)-methyltransferase 1
MMGLPDGHVTSPAIGLSWNEQLKALGNGVVPQQAERALRMLVPVTAVSGREDER